MKKRNDRASNFLRFFFLGLAIALLILLAVILVNVYRSSQREIADENLVIVDDTEAITELMTETETETDTETESEAETDTEAQTEAETEEAQTEQESETDVQTAAGEIVQSSSGEAETEDSDESLSDGQAAAAEADSQDSQTQAVDGSIIVIEDVTAEDTSTDTSASEAAEETSASVESTGVYSTLNADCNFRSEAGYEDENGNDTTIGVYSAGTVVEVLETPGGWTKVKIDGVIGYVGAQFVE
ncbi:MAG: SH3 domain-containing protein [Lachnospiraceae bacterium]|nr:SH3 domain-containing protein [Lachnospiraceae bacterium]